MTNDNDAMTGTHPVIETVDASVETVETQVKLKPFILPLPQEPPQFAPFVINETMNLTRNWKIAVGAMALLISALGILLLLQVASVNKTQAQLQEALTMQIQQLSATGSAVKEAQSTAAAAAKRAQSVDELLQATASDLNLRITESGTRLDASRRDIGRDLAKINRRIDTLEKKTFGPLIDRRMAIVPPPAPVSRPVAVHQPTMADEHHHEFDGNAPTPHGAVVLNGHWNLINTETGQPADVIPFAHNSSGIMVHSLNDGKHYLIKSDGTWIGKAD